MGAGIALCAVLGSAWAEPNYALQDGWLNDTYAPAAQAWVRDEYDRTVSVLGKDARFEALKADAAAVLTEPTRIPEDRVARESPPTRRHGARLSAPGRQGDIGNRASYIDI